MKKYRTSRLSANAVELLLLGCLCLGCSRTGEIPAARAPILPETAGGTAALLPQFPPLPQGRMMLSGSAAPESGLPAAFAQSTRGYYCDAIQASTLTSEHRDSSWSFSEGTVDMLGQESGLSFQIFYLSRLGPGDSFGQLSVELNWDGAEPTDSAGLYAGIVDWNRRRWIFCGPIHNEREIVDFSGSMVHGNAAHGLNDMCLVNYSSSTAHIRFLNFTINGGGEIPDDDTIYCIQAPADAAQRIVAISLDGSGGVDSIHEAGAAEELRELRIWQLPAGPRLAFNRRQPGSAWEVWSCLPDGSGLQLEHAADNTDFSVGDYQVEDELECYARQSGMQTDILIDNISEGSSEVFPTELSGISGLGWLSGGAVSTPSLLGRLNEARLDPVTNISIHRNFEPQVSVNSFQINAEAAAGELLDMSVFRYVCAAEQIWTARAYSWRAGSAAHSGIYLWAPGNLLPVRHRLVFSSPDAELRWPAVSPDTRWVAYVELNPGETKGQLMLQAVVSRDPANARLLLPDVHDYPVFLDPTPKKFEE